MKFRERDYICLNERKVGVLEQRYRVPEGGGGEGMKQIKKMMMSNFQLLISY